LLAAVVVANADAASLEPVRREGQATVHDNAAAHLSAEQECKATEHLLLGGSRGLTERAADPLGKPLVVRHVPASFPLAPRRLKALLQRLEEPG
jgi:hypothetical protein